jgi:hypothetical protein
VPDIVLLDAMMPGMDGFEVATPPEGLPQTAHIPIIFMTGLTETEYLVAALEAGGVDYVTKPIKPKEVLARMQVHLQGRARAAPDPQRAGRLWLCQHHGARQRRRADVADPAGARAAGAYFGTPGACTTPPEPVVAWLRRHREVCNNWRRMSRPSLSLERGRPAAEFRLHQQTGQRCQAEDGDWLIVMREVSDTAVIEAMSLSSSSPPSEAEVLYWVVKGKTNRTLATSWAAARHGEETPGADVCEAGGGDAHRSRRHGHDAHSQAASAV